jgi:hypothetical protein
MRFQDESDSGHLLTGNGLFDPPPAAPTAMSLQVNHDNVLQVAVIIRTAADEAKSALLGLLRFMVVEPCGGDIVSKEAAKAWNARLSGSPESYVGRLAAYVQNVEELADRLQENAQQYGYTEEEINNAFKSIEVRSA